MKFETALLKTFFVASPANHVAQTVLVAAAR